MAKSDNKQTEADPALGNVDDDEGVRLMLAWQGGDESAFDDLVVAYAPRVHALLTRFMGPISEREDMVQEVFLRVLRARDRYQPTARFSTWLYRIVYNLCINETAKRRNRRSVSMETSQDGEIGMELADPNAVDPTEGLEQLDVVDAVRAAIASLPDQQRMALILAKYQGLPYSEVGQVLGSSQKAVKSLVHRARENLRLKLAPFLDREVA